MFDIYLGLKFSFSYFSLLPVKFDEKDDLSKKEVLSSMLSFFPFVGLVLSSLSVLIFHLLSSLDYLGAIIAAVSYLIFYGFIHSEAIMDVADGIYAKHSGKDAYEIIKEPTVGALGVLWATSLMLVKVVALAYLFLHVQFLQIIVICMISRFSLLLLIKKEKFKSSFVRTLQTSFQDKDLLYCLGGVFFIGLFLLQFEFILLFVLGIIFSFVIAKILGKKLGFLNGDVLGTSLEAVEILLFICVALLCQ